MYNSNYTFSDLLHIFFALRLYENVRTYNDLAEVVGVSRRTIAGWFSGEYLPRSKEIILNTAEALGLTPIQADLLLYAANPSWVTYGTPASVLRSIDIVRYCENLMLHPLLLLENMPSVKEIEQNWAISFEENFQSNYQSWGLGFKDDGFCNIERMMENGELILKIQNRLHETVFMGADSSCFSPENYYASAEVKMISGDTEDEGYALIFEEISDNCHALLRIREMSGQASVVQTFDGRTGYNIYVNRAEVPKIDKGAINKIAILAIEERFWFYINDDMIGYSEIKRFSRSRIDLGIIVGSKRSAICSFRKFVVRVPKSMKWLLKHDY